MELKNKKYLYSNGSSLSAGGGFEPINLRTEIREKYKEKGIDLPKTQLECSFPYLISKNLGLECINESTSGAGLDRMIRTTFDWIANNQDKLDKTIFLLEPPVGVRLDFYVKEWNDFGILNAAKNSNNIFDFTLVKEWFVYSEEEQEEWNKKYEREIAGYLNNFFDEDISRQIQNSSLLFFVSFLNQINVDYFITLPVVFQKYTKDKLNEIIPINSNINAFLKTSTLWRYCEKEKWFIKDEVNFEDYHIGYYGNYNIANKLTKFIKQTKSHI